MTQKTVFYQQHQQSNAKIIDFNGWLMPIHYGSQIEEHHFVRQNAGMFDVSHMLIVDVKGKDATAYLQYLLANNVARLKDSGKALYSCMLNEQGGVIDDLIAYYIDKENYRLVVNAGTQKKDVAWMQKQAADFDVQIEPKNDLAMLAIQGPVAIEKVCSVLPEPLVKQVQELSVFSSCQSADWFIGRTGYTGEHGLEIMLNAEDAVRLWDDLLAVGVHPCGLGARDTLRLEAGMNLYGNDMDETMSPLSAGLEWTVAWQPEDRQFIGRAALEQQKATAEPVFFVGVLLEGRGVLRDGQKLYQADQFIGEITSGGFSPTLKKSIGFARINQNIKTCEVDIRNKRLPIKIQPTTFVRYGKVLE